MEQAKEVWWRGHCQIPGPIYVQVESRHSSWGSEAVLVTPSGPGPRFPRVEGPLVQQMWKIHVSFSYYSSSGHLIGPDRRELVAPRTDSTMAGVVQGGPGHTLDIRDYTDIHSDSDISGMGRTFLLCVVCLNMERLLLILSMTKNQILFGFQWNYVS